MDFNFDWIHGILVAVAAFLGYWFKGRKEKKKSGRVAEMKKEV